MELLYIYIEEYKNLKEQNINFGGEYRFCFDKKKNKLIVQKNEQHIRDFYNIGNNGAKILNVSSIIGENGTGKSSILQFIKDNFSRGTHLEYSTIIVIKTDAEYKVLSTYDDIKVDEPKFTLEIIDNPTKHHKIFNFGYNFRGFASTDIIFFSNIFDGTPGGTLVGLHDISTNSLIYEDYKNNIQQRIINGDEDPVAVFLTEDIYRQLVLITSEIPRDFFPFKLPKTLTIAIYQILNSFDMDSGEHKEFEKLKKAITDNYISEYLKVDEISIVEDIKQIHINYLISSVLESLVRELLQIQSQGKNLGFNFKFSGDFIVKQNSLVKHMPYEERISYFFDQIDLEINKNTVSINNNLQDLISNNKNFVKFVFKNRDKFYNYNIDHRNPAMYINIYDEEISNEIILKEFMHLYRKTFTINQYLKFSWRNLSTGENALLNIYSRFYSLSDNVIVAGQLERHLIILIDEGDTYLHPAWQKKLLKNLLDFLPIVFSSQIKTQRTIQIILTTNSAIPASDFLNYNTIFLQKVINGNNNYQTIIKDSLNEQKATFAANIHTLLSDSFFINDGLRGDFANYRINQILDFLKGKEKNSMEVDDIKRLIEQIGEPLIKNSLRELYFQKFPSTINDEIKRLIELQKKYVIT